MASAIELYLLAAGGVPQPWAAMTLQNGWTNHGSLTAQYRRFNTVTGEIIGAITAGTIAGGTVIATIPFTLHSQQELPVIVDNTTGGAGGATPALVITTSGQIQIWNLPTGTTNVSFHGFVSLDA